MAIFSEEVFNPFVFYARIFTVLLIPSPKWIIVIKFKENASQKRF